MNILFEPLFVQNYVVNYLSMLIKYFIITLSHASTLLHATQKEFKKLYCNPLFWRSKVVFRVSNAHYGSLLQAACLNGFQTPFGPKYAVNYLSML